MVLVVVMHNETSNKGNNYGDDNRITTIVTFIRSFISITTSNTINTNVVIVILILDIKHEIL
jgi:hypothetical protein